MGYIGTPIDTRNQFQSLQGKRFNGDGSTTDFTLDVAPGNVLDIEVFVGNVRQDPNSAYTVSGTTLSFTGAPPSGTNNIYVVHQAKSVGTIDVPTGGVAAGSLASSVLTGQTDIGAAIADADLFLVDDGAGGTLRKTAASRIKTYIGAGDNTPSFLVTISGSQSISSGSATKIQWNSEVYDTDGTFDSSTNYRFTPGVTGKYVLAAGTRASSFETSEKMQLFFYKNGSGVSYQTESRNFSTSSGGETITIDAQILVESDADDYFEVYLLHTEGGSRDIGSASYFYGYKLIT
jgi:hypothetical protein